MSKRMSDEDLEVYRAYALYDGLTLEAGRVVMAETIRAREAEARLQKEVERLEDKVDEMNQRIGGLT